MNAKLKGLAGAALVISVLALVGCKLVPPPPRLDAGNVAARAGMSNVPFAATPGSSSVMRSTNVQAA